ncbi:MAG: OmpA family protein [Rhodospirillales bacterium]|nr:OmpA family protein [Rhodospirillales bacterium]
MTDAARPIIIKKVKKGAHGHHGGAWKVAYADFVTAMMAFFLLLWLLNAVTDEQLEGISNYFAPISTTATTSGAGGLLGGETVRSDRDYPDPMGPSSGADTVQPARQGDYDETEVEGDAETPPEHDDARAVIEHAPTDLAELAPEDLDDMVREREEQQFEQAKQRILEAIEAAPRLKPLADSLLIDNTPEGLRIQIVDQEGLAMFPRGSADMYLHTRKLIELIAKVIVEMPQPVAITGHTDATPYATDSGYGNWELSVDRANAARRALLQYGVPPDRVSRVVGRAATDPLLPEAPEAPGNRRLSVLMLRNAVTPLNTAAAASAGL